MRVSWSGMPTTEDARKTAEAWLERAPSDVSVLMGIDPGADLRLVFGLDHLSSGDAGLLGRERFRKHSVLFLDDYLNSGSHGVRKRAVWLAKMVGTLLFPSEAEASLFRVLYPDVNTPRLAVVVVQAPEERVQKRRKREKRKEVSEEHDPLAALLVGEDDGAPEVDLTADYERRLGESAQDFWGLVRSLAR